MRLRICGLTGTVDVDAGGERNRVLAAQRLSVAPDASLDIEQLAFSGIEQLAGMVGRGDLGGDPAWLAAARGR